MTEQEKKIEDKAAAVAAKAEFDKVKRFGVYSLLKIRTKKGKFTRDEELKEAENAIKGIEGLKAKKTQTIRKGGACVTVIKGYPVSNFFSSQFTSEQKKIYFVK